MLKQSDDPQPQSHDHRTTNRHKNEVTSYPVAHYQLPHRSDKLPFCDFLALREMFKLSSKLDDLLTDLGFVY